MLLDNVERFLDAPAFSNDVFDDQYFFLWRNFESAAQRKLAVFFFGEDEAETELPGNFLADDEAAHRGGNDGGRSEVAGFGGEFSAEFFDDGHLLEGDGALKELAAVESAAEDEVALKQRAGVAEDLEDFVIGHEQRLKAKG